jgi:predicted RNA-binding protein associated with RNAse of E/G family
VIVDCDMRKWVDRPHWRFDTELLGRDEHGTWLGARIGTTYTGPRGAGAWQHNFVVLVPEDRWWIASWNDVQQPEIEVYVDITTAPRWLNEGVVTAIDLDLDVARLRDGRVELWDEDEFEEHRVRFAYPQDVVDRASATAQEVITAVEGRDEPFGEVGARWLELVR